MFESTLELRAVVDLINAALYWILIAVSPLFFPCSSLSYLFLNEWLTFSPACPGHPNTVS